MKGFLDERMPTRVPRGKHLLQTLVSLVFAEGDLGFSYVSQTKTASETFRDRSGNCLSFTNMFISMARYLGFNARLREVEIAPTWSKRGRLITFNRHVNVAVPIGGVPYVVDLFPRVDRIEIGGRIVSDDRGVAHFYNNKGADNLALGNFSLALAYFEKALEIDPKAAFVWANLGVAQGLQGEVEAAERSYLTAIDLEQKNMIAIANLAKLYERLGREELAAKYSERVEDFQETNPYYHYSLGQEAYESKQFEEAIRHYEKALKRKSKEHHFHFALAKAYTHLGKTEEAIEHLKKAHEYAPSGAGRNRYGEKLEILMATGRSSGHETEAVSAIH
jgi:Flp pilus assembly protein TadD